AFMLSGENRLQIGANAREPKAYMPTAAPLDPPGEVPSGISRQENLVKSLILVGNYPNPANYFTNIHYAVSQPQEISVQLVDVAGHVVAKLFKGLVEPGIYSLPVELSYLAPGVYSYVVITTEGSIVRQLVVMR
ncbi:MAG TPA: T9SS type A sorting domain-containing protein, partial [Patescibacteria group bacterium]|nr:T9SS type A sorting domain-containing protein [Patescibacteria group bacterium]